MTSETPTPTGQYAAAAARWLVQPETVGKAIALIVAAVVAWTQLQGAVARVQEGQDQLTSAIVTLADTVEAQGEAMDDLEDLIRDVRETGAMALRDQVDELKAQGAARDLEIARMQERLESCCSQ